MYHPSTAHCARMPAAVSLLLQALLASAAVSKRAKGRAGTITLAANLATARAACLWEMSVHGRPHLPPAALLSMAASAYPLISTEDHAGGMLCNVAMVGPVAQPLPSTRRALPALVASVTLAPSTGAVEVAFSEQKLLSGWLGGVQSSGASSAAVLAGTTATAARMLLLPAGTAGVPSTAPAPTSTAATAPLATAEAAGHAVHPALLAAAISHAAMQPADPLTPLLSVRTWVRSVAAMTFGAPRDLPVTAATISTSVTLLGEESWLAASLRLSTAGAAAGVQLEGVVVGEHALPPASPGPQALQASAAAAERSVLPGEEAAEEAAVAADNPLLAMPEEERLLHLQAQVGRLGVLL